MIEMAFAKKRVEDRKLWLSALEPGVHIDYDVENISYDDFINKVCIFVINYIERYFYIPILV
jgi:DNA topoisomerase-2